MNSEKQIDPKIFWPAIIVVLALSIPLVVFPEAGSRAVNTALGFITAKFGWLFLLFCMGCFSILMWLAFGRYGNVKLGGPNDEPEFSTISWIAMLFCAGIGIGIMLWSFIEPIYYLSGPPLGIEPHSDLAVEWAHMYGQFHWGFSAWAIYAIASVPIAYCVYVRKASHLRMSIASKGLIGRHADGPFGTLIDVLMMFGIVGGVGTSLGLAVPLVAALFGELFGIPDSFLLKIAILAIWTLIFGVSVYKGLSKGIKVLSNINLYLALIFAGFILFVGPTVFILSMWTNSFGIMLDNFFRMSFWLDPVTKGGFPEGWTVFYWAWWVAYAPMMGLFVARISKGRTIKELVIAECFWGTLGCWIPFAIFGGYALHVDINGIVPVSQILSQSGQAAAIIAILNSLPLSKLVVLVYTVLCFIFLATTLDSSAYVLASACTKKLGGNEEPARWNRVLWALVLAVVGAGLLAVGGLSAVQLSTVIVALPLVPVLIIMIASLLKWLKEDYGQMLKPKIYAIDYKPIEQDEEVVSRGSKISI
ncbi:MAG: BCCT family transporter [Clostridia bacterium]|nr:BCCT family transporter [Clostridia bacterium]